MTASISHLPLTTTPTRADDDRVEVRRDVLLQHLQAAIGAATDAASELDQLRSPAIDDVEITDGRDGRDMAAHIDVAIRGLRAAWAVGHTVFDGAAL